MTLKSLLEEKDLNLQDNGYESLKGRSEDFGEKAKEFESSTKRIRISMWRSNTKNWEEKNDSNLYKEDLNPSFVKMNNKTKDLNFRKKGSNPVIRR